MYHCEHNISIGESNTVVSAYTMYRHLQQCCSHPLFLCAGSTTILEGFLFGYHWETLKPLKKAFHYHIVANSTPAERSILNI